MKFYILLIFSILTGSGIQAQQTLIQEDSSWQFTFLNAPDIALSLLMSAAIKNSSRVAQSNAAIEMSEEDLKIGKKNLLNGLSFISTYSYGTRLNFGVEEQHFNQFNAFTLPAQAMYFTGLNINYSLFSLFSRKNELNKQTIAKKQAIASLELEEQEIRKLIIRQYQDIILAKAQLELYEEAFQTSSINLKLAERQFLNGEILLGEMSRIQEAHTTAAIAHRTARINYTTTFLLMEETIGMRIMDLMKNNQ